MDLTDRASKIKTLMEDTRTQVINKIKIGQEQQKTRQDNQHNIMTEFLFQGHKCM